MSTPSWLGVKVSIQTAKAAAKTITALTNANPGVATSTAHGFTNGQYVELTLPGWPTLDKKVIRVANVAANTFEVEGIDTTLLGTFTSGSAQLLTFANTFSTLTNVTAAGGTFAEQDMTTISDIQSKSRPGLMAATKFTFESFWDTSDAALTTAKAASDAGSETALLFTFTDGKKAVVNGFIGCSLVPTGAKGEAVKTPIELTSISSVTYYLT